MMDPKGVHQTDQLTAAYRNVGVGLAAMLIEMCERGVSNEDALEITVAFAIEMAGHLFDASRRDNA